MTNKNDLLSRLKKELGKQIRLLNPRENYEHFKRFDRETLQEILNGSISLTSTEVIDSLNFKREKGHPSPYYTIILMSYAVGLDFENEYGTSIFDLTLEEAEKIANGKSPESVLGILGRSFYKKRDFKHKPRKYSNSPWAEKHDSDIPAGPAVVERVRHLKRYE